MNPLRNHHKNSLFLKFCLALLFFFVYRVIQSPSDVFTALRGIREMKIGRYLIVLVLLMGALITFGDRGLIDNYRMKEKLMSLKKNNHEITLENIALKKNITLLRDNLSYIGMVARSELGMVNKGDLVYRKIQ
jgi:cell division protein FtsB